jgi:hypothetical protein
MLRQRPSSRSKIRSLASSLAVSTLLTGIAPSAAHADQAACGEACGPRWREIDELGRPVRLEVTTASDAKTLQLSNGTASPRSGHILDPTGSSRRSVLVENC